MGNPARGMSREEIAQETARGHMDNAQQKQDTERPYGGSCGVMAGSSLEESAIPRRNTPREEADILASYHHTEAAKAHRASRFYREHPEFEKFIQLVRAGVIQI